MGFSVVICVVVFIFFCVIVLFFVCYGLFYCEVLFYWISEVFGLFVVKFWFSKGDCGCSIMVELEVIGWLYYGFFGFISFCGSKRIKE